MPLLGDSPKGGWLAEIKPEGSVHALVAVQTDAGITGYGSVFTDGRLVAADTFKFELLGPTVYPHRRSRSILLSDCRNFTFADSWRLCTNPVRDGG